MQAGIPNSKKSLKEIIVKIELERIDIQKEVMVEILLDSSIIELIMNFEFTKKQRFKLKKIKVRNINKIFNKKELIENIVKVNIFIRDIYRENRDQYDRRSKVEC